MPAAEHALIPPDHTLVVAQDQHGLPGLGVARVFDLIHAEGPVALITALLVAQSARRAGVERALVADLKQCARSRSCIRLIVSTATHRRDAHAFYERLGFGFSGRRHGKSLPEG